MIVRLKPGPPSGWARPVSYRERVYVLTAWRYYAAARIARHLRGGRARLYAIVKEFGLPAKPLGAGSANWRIDFVEAIATEDVVAPLVRRCQVCEQLYGREECPCQMKGRDR